MIALRWLRALLLLVDGPLAPAVPLLIGLLVAVLVAKVLVDAYAGAAHARGVALASRALLATSVPLLVAFGLFVIVRVAQLASLI